MNRKVTFLICLLAGFIIAMTIYNDTSTAISAAAPIGVNLEMGKSSLNCFGRKVVCNAQATAQRTRQSDVEAFGEMSINNQGELVLKLPKNENDPVFIQEHFSNNEFELEEPFELPADILQEMQVTRMSYQIQVGRYPVVQTQTDYIVRMSLLARKK